ncbi:hypothetical protein DXB45_15465 [Clostridium sp. OM04-12AA]|nr:hypothetical protein [Clostridium sp. OM04-12AA]RHV48270.1 hypothetical protein DXB45_15465 [Clostridium sp. OM04-12AA]
MKGKKVKKDTQRISLYRVRLEKDRDLMKQRRATGIAAPEEIVKVIKPVFDGADREQFVVLYLNMKLHPIGVEIIAIGGKLCMQCRDQERIQRCDCSQCSSHRGCA